MFQFRNSLILALTKSGMSLIFIFTFMLSGCGGGGGGGDRAGLATYAVSGTVSGASFGGVNIQVTGASTTNVLTDTNGNFSLANQSNGSYTITPSKIGYSYSPTSMVINVNGANVSGTNFVSSVNAAPTYTLSGSITGAILQNVRIDLNSGASAITDSTGHYIFTGLSNGSYTATPSYSGYSFSPSSTQATISNANATLSNFTATLIPTTFTISGAVSGATVTGVTINLTSGATTSTTITDVNGNYSFTNVANGKYTVSPVKSGFTFNPLRTSISINGGNSSIPYFTATAINPSKFLMGGNFQGTPLSLTTAVTTFAGGVFAGSTDATGTAASFNLPIGITTDGVNLYVVDDKNHKIRQIVIASGAVTTLAGGVQGYADGTGTAASFNFPTDITTDGTNLYVTDAGCKCIRQIVIASGVVTTLAGGKWGYADGIGTAAMFHAPLGITTDGINLYVTDVSDNLIRKIVIASAMVTTFAGTGSVGATNGIGTAASFNEPESITTDGTNLFVADFSNNIIRKIVISSGSVTTLAGTGALGATDGAGSSATFNKPIGISTDGVNLYVADGFNNKVRQIVISSGAVTTVAGSGATGSADGTGGGATFYVPRGITTDGNSLYVTDQNNFKIRKIQ